MTWRPPVCRCVTDATAKDAAAVAANNALLLGLLDDAEQQLASSSFLAGPAYSVADVMFTPVLFRCAARGCRVWCSWYYYASCGWRQRGLRAACHMCHALCYVTSCIGQCCSSAPCNMAQRKPACMELTVTSLSITLQLGPAMNSRAVLEMSSTWCSCTLSILLFSCDT